MFVSKKFDYNTIKWSKIYDVNMSNISELPGDDEFALLEKIHMNSN